MKKIFGIVFFFSTLMIFGQGQRFVYEYKFKPSKKANDSVRTELMNLDVFKDYSVYYGQKKFQSDSMSMNTFIEQHKNGDTFFSASGIGGYWNSGDVIHKKKPDNKILWKTNVGENSLEVEDQLLGKWKIESETQTIANYPCQKAELDFGGRKWTAWFTTKIPIQDGPYKFSGLPGLIVALNDHSGSHNFVLKGANKLENEQQSWEYISTLQLSAIFPPAFQRKIPHEIANEKLTFKKPKTIEKLT